MPYVPSDFLNSWWWERFGSLMILSNFFLHCWVYKSSLDLSSVLMKCLEQFPPPSLSPYGWGRCNPTPHSVSDSNDAPDGAAAGAVGAAEYPGVNVEPLQPAEERESLSRCLCDGVIVARPGQVQVHLGFKVNPGEPEAAEALLRSPIDGWVGPRCWDCCPGTKMSGPNNSLHAAEAFSLLLYLFPPKTSSREFVVFAAENTTPTYDSVSISHTAFPPAEICL